MAPDGEGLTQDPENQGQSKAASLPAALRTDRLYLWLITIALLGARRWGWGADRISHLTTGE